MKPLVEASTTCHACQLPYVFSHHLILSCDFIPCSVVHTHRPVMFAYNFPWFFVMMWSWQRIQGIARISNVPETWKPIKNVTRWASAFRGFLQELGVATVCNVGDEPWPVTCFWQWASNFLNGHLNHFGLMAWCWIILNYHQYFHDFGYCILHTIWLALSRGLWRSTGYWSKSV